LQPSPEQSGKRPGDASALEFERRASRAASKGHEAGCRALRLARAERLKNSLHFSRRSKVQSHFNTISCLGLVGTGQLAAIEQ
jgi:hypothetical protein